MTDRKVIYLPTVGEAELRDALAKVGGKASIAADLLGVHRSTVYRLMARYDIPRKLGTP